MGCINEQLYFYMKGNASNIPDDWNNGEFWYTIGCYWIDHCGGGSNALWYMRKVFNYVILNDFLTEAEIINRKLQLVHVLRQIPDASPPELKPSPPSWSDIIRKTKCNDAHLCNYNWICTVFMEAEDKIRVRKCMSLAMIKQHTGFMVTLEFRNQPLIVRDILICKLKLNTT